MIIIYTSSISETDDDRDGTIIFRPLVTHSNEIVKKIEA